MSKYAWVTLTTNDTYSLGALVLAHSLRRVGTAHQLAVLVTPTVSESMRNKLKDVYNIVQEVNVLDSQDAANLALLARPELGITFTKLHCWRLVQFEKCVFLDADTMVLQNCDELFEREELSAAPDVSWPDCFNSGVFVYKPSVETFDKIAAFAVEHGSFDGGDQGLLNLYFADWAQSDIKKHLPFVYNVTAYASYCYLPAFKQFRDKIKILHFAGKLKPWLIQFNSETRTACTPSEFAHAADLIQLWWSIFCDNVHHKLTDNMPQANRHFQHQYNHHHHQKPHEQEHLPPSSSPPPPSHYGYGRIKEFRDPWEDYYENLAKQNGNNENQNDNNTHNNTDNDNKSNSNNDNEQVHCPPSDNDINNDNDTDVNSTHSESLVSPCEQHGSTHASNSNDTPATIAQTEVQPLQLVEDYQKPSENESESEPAPMSTEALPDTDNTLNEFLESTQESSSEAPAADVTNEANNEAGLAGALSQLRLGAQRTPEQEAYEQLMRRQCWEAGQIDYAGKDSFENIWKKITQTLETKPTPQQEDKPGPLTSAEIQDGKIEIDPVTKAKTQYKLIEGGYEVITTTPQPNGTMKTQVRTFWDPKPVSEEDLKKEAANKKLIKSRMGKEIRIDKNTTMLTREIPGGYEEVYTTVNDDGTRSMRTKTFYDSVPQEMGDNSKPSAQDKKKKTVMQKTSSVDSTDSTESRKIVHRKDSQSNYKQETTVEESRRVTQNIEYSENNRAIENKDASKKKTKKKNIPPPPPDFIENDTTTVSSKRVPGGVQYTYSTKLESGKTITTTKTVYEEEEVDMTEEEIREYQKTLKDAEKHKNVTTTKKLRSKVGTKEIVPSQNPGEVTTVETIKIEGATEYHYTTVTPEGIVKKAVKTVYDPVPSQGGEDSDQEIIEDYEEEIIEPGEKNVRTIETVKQLPKKFEEEVTITHERKEKKIKKTMISH